MTDVVKTSHSAGFVLSDNGVDALTYLAEGDTGQHRHQCHSLASWDAIVVTANDFERAHPAGHI